jgi:DNA end-binding protein Ku
MLNSKGEPLKRDYHSAETGKGLEREDTVRGFEITPGNYVTVTDEELERLAPTKSRDIQLQLFVKRDEVSPVYFERAYFLTPTEKSGKAYHLLAEVMERSNSAGIATFVMHGREHMVSILSIGGILRAQTLRFNDEVRTPPAIAVQGEDALPSRDDIERFEAAIEKGLSETLNRDEMRDEYADAMLRLIESKTPRRAGKAAGKPAASQPSHVIDLMEVLKESLVEKRPRQRTR